MSLVLDAGALLAVERGDREVIALLKLEFLRGSSPVTHGGVVGQVWRGGAGRQALLARYLPRVEVVPLGDALGRQAGALLARTETSDVIDAAVVLLAEDGDTILTSDADELRSLAETADLHVDLVPV